MANAPQKAYGNFSIIHDLYKRAGVPVYPVSEILSLKAPVNASAIQRLQNMHQGEATQQDQEGNQQGNGEEFVQPQEHH